MNRKQLPSQEYLRSILDYDPTSGIFTWKWRADMPRNWNMRRAGKPAGSLSKRGYVNIMIDDVGYRAHRLAWMFVHGSVPFEIDHEDGHGDHNWLSNLREADHFQNMQNKRGQGRGLKGVSRWRGRFAASIRSGGTPGKLQHLGIFATEEAAHAAYVAAAQKLFGEFARAA